MTIDDLRNLIAPLHRRVVNLAVRAVVRVVDDAKKMQLLQVEAVKDELRDDVEHFQPYGFSSNPKAGAEAILLRVGAREDHTIAIVVNDRRYRVHDLESEEVCVYDSTGSKILLKSNGDIEVTPSSGKVTLTGDLSVSGKLDVGDDATFSGDASVSGDTTCDGTVTGSTDVIGGGKHLKTHTHSGSSLTTTATIGPSAVPGVISGDTLAPN